ncbi:MAG TPA: SpoIIE family protein phosphatase [Methylomirabilota bacterium]|nr:SpoIIE family protein phosphatase [Methylomirabilota bacterium]
MPASGVNARATEGGEPVIRILLIEDQPEYAGEIRRLLEAAEDVRFELEVMERVAEAAKRLEADDDFDVVLLDLSLAEGAGLSNLDRLYESALQVPVVVLSGVDDENVAVQAVHEGAQDYLVKGQINTHLLTRSLRYAIERQAAETALLEAEEKYRGIFENTFEGIFQTTPDGGYISANPALAQIYGYESADDLMANIRDIGSKLYVDPNRRHEFRRLMEENDTVTGFESQVYRRDGTVIWISENVRAVRDGQGRLQYYEGTVEDITQRVQAEASLRDSEALYHSLVENLPQNILRKDLNERFTFANQRFCQTLGRPLEEILGTTDFDFFPPELAAKYQRDDRKILETGKLFEAVEEHHPPGGDKLYVQVVKTPLYDARGEIIGLQGIFWDITEKKLAEEQAKRANAELARSREELRAKNEQMEEDIRMAREIQQAILPQQYPSFPRQADPVDSALRFCHRYFPSGTVGGDFYTVVALSDTKAGLFVCDVMGHGVQSALVTAMLRALVEELTATVTDPGQLLGQMNRDLRAILKQTGNPMFTTAFYLVADLATGQMRYANAGHPKQMVVRQRTGKVEYLPLPGGKARPPLGLVDDSSYPTAEQALEEGDRVILYTDGLYEVEGPDETLYTQEMLMEAVGRRVQEPLPELFDGLIGEIREFAVDGLFGDDVCILGMDVARLEVSRQERD